MSQPKIRFAEDRERTLRRKKLLAQVVLWSVLLALLALVCATVSFSFFGAKVFTVVTTYWKTALAAALLVAAVLNWCSNIIARVK